MAARGETQVDVEVSTLVVPAWRLRWKAPELALVLGERALALAAARRDEADRLRAEALVVFASNRIGRGVRIADRALDALKAAETAAEHQTAWLLRIELAGCARSVGAPLTGFAAVRPVLEAQGVPYALRAAALVEASECIVTVGRGDEPAYALNEADRLYAADTILDPNTKLLLRGLLRAVSAAQLRRWGDIPAAIGAAREGLDLLNQADPAADSGQARGRLTLELVCALMDANKLADASEVGNPLLERPVRAPSASTSGWLRLALATRVHLPAGRITMAREMLRDAATSAERHQLDTLLAESLLALAHVHEVSGELVDALTNLRAAHAAERRRARAVYSVRARLAAEFSGVHRQPSSLHQQLADLLRSDGGPPRPPAADEALPAELKQQLRQWRPVQVRKGEGLKVKRVRRAAEDMTVEGLSAARAHAADRWRMVQPFGEPEDMAPDSVDEQPSDRTVPAAGLIASAGAMISGRRRAARVAAGDIEDDETPEQQPQASEPAPQSDSVMDMLKAAGLRQGGRRRAKDADDDSEPQQWRVEAPSHLRSHAEPEPTPPEPLAQEPLPHSFFEPTTAVQPVVGPDGLPNRPPRSSYTTAYGQEPAEPHIDPPAPDPRSARPYGLAAAFGRGTSHDSTDAPPTGEPHDQPTSFGSEPSQPATDIPADTPAPFGHERATDFEPGTDARSDRPTFEPPALGSSGTQGFSGLGAAFGQAQPEPRFDGPPFDFGQPPAEQGPGAPGSGEAPAESRSDAPGSDFGQAPGASGSGASGFDFGRRTAESGSDGPGSDFGRGATESRSGAQGSDFGRAPGQAGSGASDSDFGRGPGESRSDASPFDFGKGAAESRSGVPGFEPSTSDPYGTRARFEALAFEPPASDVQLTGFEEPDSRPGRGSSGLAAAFGRPSGERESAFGQPESRVPAPQPERETDPEPEPEPFRRPPVPEPVPDPPSPEQPPVPDPVPSVPIPDEVPAPTDPDLMSSSFLSTADIEDEPPVRSSPWQSYGQEPATPESSVAQSDWVQLAQPESARAERPDAFSQQPEPGASQVSFGLPDLAASWQSQAESGRSRSDEPGAAHDQLGYTELGYARSEPAQPGHAPTGQSRWEQDQLGYTEQGYAEQAQPGPSQPPHSAQPSTNQPEPGTGLPWQESAYPMLQHPTSAQPEQPQSEQARPEQAHPGTSLNAPAQPDTTQHGQTQAGSGQFASGPAEPGRDPGAPHPDNPDLSPHGYSTSAQPGSDQAAQSQPNPAQAGPEYSIPAQAGPNPDLSTPGYPASAQAPTAQPQPDPAQFAQGPNPAESAQGYSVPAQAGPNPAPAQVQPSGEASTKDPSLPSSRRRQSDMGLAELLAEALVAYETGKRDEEQEHDQLPRDPERTGPINPVEPPNTDSETTGPIRRVEESPFGGWTLPGS